MRALFKPSAAPGLEMIECAEPTPGPYDVKIRVEKTGICGTDLHIDSWDAWAASAVNAPLIIGHEFSGRIVEMGSEVKALELGALVSGEGHIICGTCRNCRAGRRHMCKNTL
jgi:threonine 3-dehydrogenase